MSRSDPPPAEESLHPTPKHQGPRNATRFRYFVAVSPGLELLLAAELEGLGFPGQVTPGGVECSGSIEDLWRIHDRCRLAESVRLRLRPFDATSFVQLEQNLKRLPWHAYLRANVTPVVSVVCEKSRLYHTEAIKERLLRVVSDSWRSSASTSTSASSDHLPAATAYAPKIHVRIVRNTVQISIDASGDRLHRRGYRVHVGVAPLRETLAAATIQLLQSQSPNAPVLRLWDPCCGSGTLLGEWLLMSLPAPPLLKRAYAYETWPIHDAKAYATWLEQGTQESRRQPVPEIAYRAFGSDCDVRAIAAARHNLARAQLEQHCELLPLDFRAAVQHIPLHTAVATNLPYGVRLQDQSAARNIFQELDRLLIRRSDLSPAIVLSTVAPPSEATQRWSRVATFANGGLRVSAWTRLR